MTSDPETPRRRLEEFDILRTVAVLLLILHHGGLYTFSAFGIRLLLLRDYVGLYLLGLFVFVAGSLCAFTVDRYKLGGYLLGRLVRIYVPYLISLFLFLWLLVPKISTVDLVAHLLGAQILLSPRLATPILTLWFVGLILVCYLIFALLLRGFRRTSSLLVASAAVFTLAGLLRATTGFIDHRFFYYFPIFVAGAITTRAGWPEKPLPGRASWLIGCALTAAGVFLLSPLKAEMGTARIELIGAIAVFLSGTILISLLLANRLVRLGWGVRFFRYVSHSSFYAYLLHRPIWQLCLLLYRPATREGLSILLIVSGFLLVVPISNLLQTGYDKLLRTAFPRYSGRAEQ